jgi:hypothetical protein
MNIRSAAIGFVAGLLCGAISVTLFVLWRI